MPFNPGSFNYRNVFKDDAVLSSIAGSAEYVSNRIGIDQYWQGPGYGAVMKEWKWHRARLTTRDPADLVNLAARTPGRLSMGSFDADHAPPVPALPATDVLWEADGPWSSADCEIYLNPVSDWRAKKGVAVMGVEGVSPGCRAELYIVAPGPTPSPHGGIMWRDFIPVATVRQEATETPVYLRVEIDTHRGTCVLSKSATENGPPTWRSVLALDTWLHDARLWPMWRMTLLSAGPGFDGGVDVLPILPPTPTTMTLRLNSALPPSGTYTAVQEGWSLDMPYVAIDWATWEWLNIYPPVGVPDPPDTPTIVESVHAPDDPMPPWFRPLVSIGDTVVPGQAIAEYDYSGGGNPRTRLAPVAAGGADLNLLAWRNVPGVMSVGGATVGVVQNRALHVSGNKAPGVKMPPGTSSSGGGGSSSGSLTAGGAKTGHTRIGR